MSRFRVGKEGFHVFMRDRFSPLEASDLQSLPASLASRQLSPQLKNETDCPKGDVEAICKG